MRETNQNTKIQLYCCGHLGDLGDLGDQDDPAIVGCVQPRSRSGLALFSQACRVPDVQPGLGKALWSSGQVGRQPSATTSDVGMFGHPAMRVTTVTLAVRVCETK